MDETISAIKIIYDYDSSKYYKIVLNGDIEIYCDLEIWSKEAFKQKVETIGLMYGEFNICKAYCNQFLSIDEFMLQANKYTYFPKDDVSISFPEKKKLLDKKSFINTLNLYMNEEFFTEYDSELICINFNSYKQGFIYADESTYKILGCEIGNFFYFFEYAPYI